MRSLLKSGLLLALIAINGLAATPAKKPAAKTPRPENPPTPDVTGQPRVLLNCGSPQFGAEHVTEWLGLGK